MLTGLTFGAMAAVGFAVIYLLFPFLTKWTRKTNEVEIVPVSTAGTSAHVVTKTEKVVTSSSGKKWWSVTSWSMITIYASILLIMILMLTWGPNLWIKSWSDLYQIVALTMIIVGAFLFAISSGKRIGVFVMMLVFSVLAFNKPEVMAVRVETAKTAGVTSIFKPAPPTPDTPQEQARKVAVAKQETEVAEARRLTEIATQKQAARDEQLAYDALFTPAKVGKCIRLNTDKVDCVTVEFDAYTQYDRYAPTDHCVLRTVDGIERIPLGDGSGWWRYRTETPAIGQFFTGGPNECG